ncbi:hypothetical protein [Hydrogenophaga sp. BPS33]|uniref:hypothetical protein n=1 Tax=Hydrogenophaga sp. BPS33 TaxID=2651974 RepID=UPI00131FC9EE|nr:hypothetical protein [Hydrogenophaga sp. BPS33]QHE86274.1 hypothetical protein F9K07_15860 [Hydrogenophaga sp. BPS33]
MRRVREFEIWSKRRELLPADFGKALAVRLWALGVPEHVVLGLNFIPDETDSLNLKSMIEDGELTLEEFVIFCKENSLVQNISSVVSAGLYLEYCFGRCLAWIHFPEDCSQESFVKLVRMVELQGCRVVDPETLMDVVV